jgi:hypothetical protein
MPFGITFTYTAMRMTRALFLPGAGGTASFGALPPIGGNWTVVLLPGPAWGNEPSALGIEDLEESRMKIVLRNVQPNEETLVYQEITRADQVEIYELILRIRMAK